MHRRNLRCGNSMSYFYQFLSISTYLHIYRQAIYERIMKTRKRKIDNCQTTRREMTKFYCTMWYACDICAHMEEIVWAIKWFLQIECIFTTGDECDRATSSRKAMGGVLPRNRAINARRRIAFRRKQTKWKKHDLRVLFLSDAMHLCTAQYVIPI